MLVEDEADNTPSKIVEGCCGWDLAGATEDEGCGEVAEGDAREGAGEKVE